ncbi:ABC transporter ATP-binding protein [Microlunatus parietis]|uniref:Peptide/nickel transport system ATP-binding protein n=1 Tax=Microlunatus parietis TaxID=682979 RepID=A0A7Y9ICY9_9ACTN|nr:ABC transporter ATP-binding protein [Microlunatus parietis]NYE74316.1 peptide/nickel transport system ATP-binding protein [Microlunatus parietis]
MERANEPVLRIAGMKTHFFTREGVVKAVDGVDLAVPRGKTVCVVGESGCGKSITARSIMRLIERPGRIIDGSIEWRPDPGSDTMIDITKLGRKDPRLRTVRGGDIGMIFQEPMASLSPMYTIGDQLTEAIRIHRKLGKAEARDHAIDMLRKVGIPQPEYRIDSFPFQLSGGMCQRAMIAIALSCSPKLLIADEPTTALDVTTQARILDLLAGLQADSGMSMLFITHDMGVVAEIADEVTVMYLGRVAEHGTVDQIFGDPKHPYTRALLESIPTMRAGRRRQALSAIRGMIPHPQNRPAGCPFNNRCDHAIKGVCDQSLPALADFGGGHVAYCHLYDRDGAAGQPGEPTRRVVELETPAVPRRAGQAEAVPGRVQVVEPAPGPDGGTAGPPPEEVPAPLMQVRDLKKYFPVRSGAFRRAKGEVRAVDGVSLAIRPGETLGLVGESGCGKSTLGRTIARILEPTSGSIEYRRRDGSAVDVSTLGGAGLVKYRTDVRVIFQDPFSSLNPRMTLEQLVGEPLRNSGLATGSELRDRVAEILKVVGLRPEYLKRYPHAFSGGERQRINIARALVTNPRMVIADEAVSALDVSVRAQILNLLGELQDAYDLTYLFISHDLSVVEHISDRVAVMYLGKIAERAGTDELYRAPQHPYTEALLHAVPIPDPAQRGSRHGYTIADDLPDPADPPPGCPFHTRCRYVNDGCTSRLPELRPITGAGHLAACHYSEELELSGL